MTVPKALDVRAEGVVTITLSLEDQRTLADALDNILDKPDVTWTNRTIGQSVAGTTVRQFVTALRRA
jgi:hypothetical protein